MTRPLEKYVNEKLHFIGTVVSFGRHKKTGDETVLFYDVGDLEATIHFKHTWCVCTKSMNSKTVRKGQIIQFEAKVKPYKKGRRTDFGLESPKKIKLIGRNKRYNEVEILPPSKKINLKDYVK